MGDVLSQCHTVLHNVCSLTLPFITILHGVWTDTLPPSCRQGYAIVCVVLCMGHLMDTDVLLAAGWRLVSAEAFLFFPGTDSIETLAVFERDI